MKFDTALVDMDGVLSDFHSHALRAHGITPFPRLQWPSMGVPLNKLWELDAIKYLSLRQETELEKAAFWHPINSNPMFWEELEPFYWIDELLELLESKVGRGNVEIATAGSKHPSSYSGKRQWLMSNGLGRFEPIIIGKKWRLSHPGTILIDDWEKHEGFTKRGGSFCLFPQQWNRNHAEAADPVRYVAQYLEHLEKVL